MISRKGMGYIDNFLNLHYWKILHKLYSDITVYHQKVPPFQRPPFFLESQDFSVKTT